ncbi:MAG: hypothetical protein EBQ89_02685 [Alphaproteobacteria bacterium]|nr:hypothetical protein [Alphaproteobacteria bacterium]
MVELGRVLVLQYFQLQVLIVFTVQCLVYGLLLVKEQTHWHHQQMQALGQVEVLQFLQVQEEV